jgi:hypothetical protein
MSAKIQLLQESLAQARREEANRQSRKMFKCSCGKMHQIKQCAVIQTHWYTRPSGCTGGDYWNAGELRIICPTTQVRNRVMFKLRSEIEWNQREEYRYNPAHQFSTLFVDLFKEIIEDYDDDKGATANNYYFDQNHKKFGIKISKP